MIVEGSKVGQMRREGTLVSEIGRMIKVRWEDGQESLLTPAPGSVKILPGTAKSAAQSARSGARAASRSRKKPPATGRATKRRR